MRDFRDLSLALFGVRRLSLRCVHNLHRNLGSPCMHQSTFAQLMLVCGPRPFRTSIWRNERHHQHEWHRFGRWEGRQNLCSSHDTNVVHETARIHPSVTIGPFSVICEGVQIGAGTTIGSGCMIRPDVVIGSNCKIKHNVTVANCTLGDKVILWPGVRVGQDGFGFLHAKTKDSTEDEHQEPVVRKPQTLRVVLHDGVELGANTTVDRGSWRDTEIGAHTKIDNQVQIAHNVVIGQACFIAAQTGIAGSVSMGDFVQVGGQVGIAQYVQVGSRCMIAGKSGVMSDLREGGVYGGAPAVPIREWHRQTIALRREVRKAQASDDLGDA